jgi:hypothetical protein
MRVIAILQALREPSNCARLRFIERVGINHCRNYGRTMTKDLRDGDQGDAVGKHKRRSGMAQIVKADRWQFGLLEDPLKMAAQDRDMNGCAGIGGENEIAPGTAPVLAKQGAFFILIRPMLLQHAEQIWVKR